MIWACGSQPRNADLSVAPATPTTFSMTELGSDNDEVFKVPSDPCELRVPKQAVLEKLKQFNYDEKSVFAVKLALEEALSNAVKHGNRNDPDKQVTFRYSIDSEQAVFVIRDEGEGFEPEEVPDCTSPERLPLPNGRGIMLIRAYMDEVEYRDCGRELYFVKFRMPPTVASDDR
ncbi:MAG: ATP-binding protein [Phycisphaerales bacterium]|nr:MAG: ATP-binding protein [Phycisphaerales bacterium]